MNGCCSLVKYLLILINFVFWTAGIIAFIALGWALTNPSISSSITKPENYSYIALCVFVVIATLTLIIAFLGCCGALKESQCMLVSFFCFLLIVLVAEVATGVYAYQYRDKLHDLVKFNIKETVKNEYNISDTKTTIFDMFQSHFECCGAESPLDWQSSKFNHQDSLVLELSQSKKIFKVPKTCCRYNTTKELCSKFEIDYGSSNLKEISAKGVIYTNGCTNVLLKLIRDNQITILAIFAGIIGVEMIALLISLCLCCAVGGREDHYKS